MDTRKKSLSVLLMGSVMLFGQGSLAGEVFNYHSKVIGDIRVILGSRDIIEIIPNDPHFWETLKCVYDADSIKKSSMGNFRVTKMPDYVMSDKDKYVRGKDIDEDTSRFELLKDNRFDDWSYLNISQKCSDAVSIYWR